MIKNTVEVKVYEKKGEEPDFGEHIVVQSHWNQEALVILAVGEETVTVKARDLLAAIQNCTNIARF